MGGGDGHARANGRDCAIVVLPSKTIVSLEEDGLNNVLHGRRDYALTRRGIYYAA